jgi:hypothetical protein
MHVKRYNHLLKEDMFLFWTGYKDSILTRSTQEKIVKAYYDTPVYWYYREKVTELQYHQKLFIPLPTKYIVSRSILLQKTHSLLLWVVLSLSIIALTAELLPEVKAKMIVIPTLVLMIILSIIEISQRWTVKSQ